MDNSRLIALACGLIVMIIIIMIGKSCMGTPDTSGMKKPVTKQEDSGFGISIATGTEPTEPPVFDIFGRPVEVTTVSETLMQETSTETTTVVIETDVFGNVITTTVPVETDIFGMEVTTVSTETTTEVITEFPEETTTISPLEQYQNELNDPHSIGGFNHGQYDSEGNPIPTLPPDFAIIIN